jgi:hypothetical protein
LRRTVWNITIISGLLIQVNGGMRVMGPGYFVIAILGCADGSTACKPVATMPTQYASVAQCTAATEEALMRNSDLDFPTLMAQCRSVKAPASAERKGARIVPAGARRS